MHSTTTLVGDDTTHGYRLSISAAPLPSEPIPTDPPPIPSPIPDPPLDPPYNPDPKPIEDPPPFRM
ncbi:hypothetical protein SJI19_02215 [Acerihabitans sp. TG2]|uniref:hypothetical protein n=1 Tax=Acerihabitans sp. TG2 TaxID=3096008 RepID=UPI002B228B04|nr:hypothetical protein [Acerihabitans sp. TG2]MEA9389378.1 hypothetical protein [Acerihabitans sp. TG2]